MGNVLGALCTSVLGRPAEEGEGGLWGARAAGGGADEAPGRRSSVERPRQAPWAEACGAVGAGFSPQPLVELAVRAVCDVVSEGGGARGLPPDLAQRVFDAMAAARRVDLPLLAGLSDWGLQSVALPGDLGADDAWVVCGVLPHGATLLVLDLSHSCVGDASARRLGDSLLALRELRLDHCARLSDAGLAGLGALRGLRALSLAGCPVTDGGLAHLAALRELRALDVSRCPGVRGGLEALAGLDALEDLNLGSCFALSDAAVAPLAALGALRALCLANTKITDSGLCAALAASRPRLKALDVSGCEALSDEAVVHIARACPSLASLGASRCPLLGGPRGAAALAGGCPRLRALNLGYTRAADASLAALAPGLETLALDACKVGDEGVAALAKACGHSLRALDLSDTRITDAGAAEIARGCPALRRLAVSFTGVGDAGVAALAAGCPALEDLGIDTAHVTDEALRHLPRLKALGTLDLFGARVTDKGAAHLGRCVGLRVLDACGGALTDAGVDVLARLPHLEQLNLAHNRAISDASVPALAGMPSLVRLNVARTRVSRTALAREFQRPPSHHQEHHHPHHRPHEEVPAAADATAMTR